MKNEYPNTKANGNSQDPNPQHGNDEHGHHGKQDENHGQDKRQTPSHAVAWIKLL